MRTGDPEADIPDDWAPQASDLSYFLDIQPEGASGSSSSSAGGSSANLTNALNGTSADSNSGEGQTGAVNINNAGSEEDELYQATPGGADGDAADGPFPAVFLSWFNVRSTWSL